MTGSKTRRLLQKVAVRQGIASLGKRFHLFLLTLAALYGLLLLISRLLGVIPNHFDPRTLSILALAALALAVVFRHRLLPTETAHLIDVRMKTHDLYLTAALIDASLGKFKPLVLSQAEEQAQTIPPKRVVPYVWQRQAGNVAAALVVLLVGVLFLPQLDPFGKEQERARLANRRQQLEEKRTATTLRKAALLEKRDMSELSRQMALAIQELKQTFNKMKPTDKAGNLERLSKSRKELGELWRKTSQKKLANAFKQTPSSQRFGAGDTRKTGEWKQGMEKGDISSLKKELAELRRMAAELARVTNPAQQAALRKQIGERLGNLAQFATTELNAAPLSAALARALDQLEMSALEGLSQEALAGFQESLNLTELEFANLAQLIQDLGSLEDALQALQLAQACNLLGLLDGKACAGCQGTGDYAALYAELMAGACSGQGVGPGMRGPGIGVGGTAPEDLESQTAFKTDRARSAITSGKVLLSWKTQELSDPGEAREEYLRHVQEVKQGVSEAILHEQVPPGYHEAIRKYFDTMEEAHAQPGEE